MIENPNEFYYLIEDAIEEQVGDTVKTQSCRLLSSLCRNIDGSITYAVVLCAESIIFSMQHVKIEEISDNFLALRTIKESSFLQ